ncbi:MAG: DMT family transporter [Fimbriimonadaceae bacterium]
MNSRLPQWLNGPMLLVTLFWGFNFVAMKMAFSEIGVSASMLGRYLVMLLMLWGWAWIARRRLRYRKEDVFPLLWQGFVSMGLYIVVFMEGVHRSGAGEAAIMLATAPIFGMFIAAAMGEERFNLAIFLCAVLALVGVAGVAMGATSATGNTLFGNLLVLISAALWAYSAALSRKLVRRYSPLDMLTLGLPGAAILLIPYGLLATWNAPWDELTSSGWVGLLWLILLGGLFGFLLFYRGVQAVGVSGAMVYQFCVPVVAALSAWIFLQAPMSGLQWFSMGVVIASVAAASYLRFQTSKKGPSAVANQNIDESENK